ncbi:MAG: orotidine-5'-phosphate decarboxylase [Gammaproteobacteria bacterium]|nr:orotidine-5'-phosphate decarboxylase [Gammaproteobacteria bacterium]|tara:strand:+ start:284 stop:955 length:672 start_codon:yes stop_codon:yes gene_type:complete
MPKKIIVAVDEIDLSSLRNIIDCLDPNKCMIKIGSVSFNSIGKKAVEYASKKGFEIFLDLKLHDIPNTVNKSIEGLKNMPIKMLTVHTSGGAAMMKSAMHAVKGTDIQIFGVTALTSLSDNDTNDIYNRDTTDQVDKMLDLAELAGIDGVVCSPHEIELILRRHSLLSITPGIRLNDMNDDQNRVMTPTEAIKLGADFLVIGRPITSSKDIKKSLDEIFKSIQ